MSPRYGRLVILAILIVASPRLQADDAERLDSYGDPLPPGAVLRLGTLRLRQERFHALTYSPDGTTLATASGGEPVRIWDVKTGKLLRTFGTGNPRMLCVAFAPDGRTLVAGGNDTALHRWDVATGKEMKGLDGHDSGVSAVAFSADGRTLVSASYDRMVRLWDVASGKMLFKLAGHTEAASCAVFAGDTVISGGEDTIIRLWSVKTGEAVAELRGHTGEVRGLAVAPDQKTLASVSWDGSVRIWDLGEQKLLHRCLGHKSSATALAWLKDGKTVVSGGWDGSLLWWDAGTGNLLRTATVSGNGQVLSVLAASPDGKTVVSAGGLAAPQFWDAATGKHLDRFAGHLEGVTRIAYAADARTIVTFGRDRTLHWWDAGNGRLLRRQAEPVSADTREPRFSVLSPAGRLWAQVTPDHDVHVGMADGKLERKPSGEQADPESRAARSPVSALAFAPDERRLAIGYTYGGIGVWQLTRGKALPTCDRRGNYVKALAFSGDGRMLASLEAGERGCRLWEVASGRLRGEIQDVAGQSLTLSADGRSLALWIPGPTITVCATATATVRCACRLQTGQLTEAAFSPDSRFIAGGTTDGRVVLWDAASGKQCHVFKGPPGGILSLAFAPDGRRLVAGSSDTTALVWEVPETAPLKVEPGPPLTDKELESLWADLSEDDAPAAWKAIRRLAAAPAQSLPFLKEKLRPRPLDVKRIGQLIADLDDGKFDVRQRATAELERLGPAAEVALKKTLDANPPLEMQQRVQRLLAKLANLTLSPDALRTWRGMEALEQIGTAETRPILETIVEGSSLMILVEEAKATLGRIK